MTVVCFQGQKKTSSEQSLQSQVNKQATDISSLKEKLEAAETALEAEQKDKAAVQEAKSSNDELLSQRDSVIKELESKLGDKIANIDSLTDKTDQLEKDKGQLQHDLESSKAAYDKLVRWLNLIIVSRDVKGIGNFQYMFLPISE